MIVESSYLYVNNLTGQCQTLKVIRKENGLIPLKVDTHRY